MRAAGQLRSTVRQAASRFAAVSVAVASMIALTACSMSSAVVKRPGAMRNACRAQRAPSPNIAFSTPEVSTLPVEQALEAEKLSLSRSVTHQGERLHVRDREGKIVGQPLAAWAVREGRRQRLQQRVPENVTECPEAVRFRAARVRAAIAKASPMPTIRAVGTVPGRNPRS